MNASHNAISRWFSAHRHELTALGASLDGGEPGRVDPAAFKKARLRILFCRLSSYRDVRHSISHRMLYWAAATVHGVYPDLAWLPPPRDAELMTAAQIPWWTASGAKRPPADFDIVAISISTPQEALNLPAALRHSGLALSHAERMNDHPHPLVILGGQAAASVPFIHGNAGPNPGGLVDLVCLGDGIQWLREFLSLCLPHAADRSRKPAILAEAARLIPGSYVPHFYTHTLDPTGKLAIATAHPDAPLPARHRIDPADSWTSGYDGAFIPFDDEDQEETLALAVGCRFRCRFCQTGWIRKEHAVTDSDALVARAARLKSAMAASDLNLLAADACSVPNLAPLLQRLTPSFRHVSVKSLALAALARHPDSADAILRLGKHEFAFGVEGISTRLRRWLGKDADASLLLDALRRCARSGIRQLKLFFILTGREEDRDIDELHALLASVRTSASCRAIASFTPLFHAPFTPLQFAALAPPDDRALRDIRQAVTHAGAEFRLSASPAEIRLINLLCRAGRRATETLRHLSLDLALRYDDAIPAKALYAAERHLAAQGISPESLSGETADSVLPWDDVQAGHSRERLLHSYRAAESGLRSNPAPAAPRLPAPVTQAARPPVRQSAPPEREWSFWIRLSPGDAWQPDVTLARGALRRMFLKDPALAKAYRGSPRLTRFPMASGLALLQATFTSSAETLLAPVTVSPSPLPDAPWHLIRFALDPARAPSLLDILRRNRIPFQSVRRARQLWHVVSPTHRTGAGLCVAVEAASAFYLLCTPKLFGLLPQDRRLLVAGGVAEGFYEWESRKCRTCGSHPLRPIRADSKLLPHPNCLCTH